MTVMTKMKGFATAASFAATLLVGRGDATPPPKT